MSDPHVQVDPVTGQLVGVLDPVDSRPVLAFSAGPELHLNGRPLELKLVRQTNAATESITQMEVCDTRAYGAGYRLAVTRLVTFGGDGLHTGAPSTAHIRYHVQRVPWGDYSDPMDMIWGAPLESTLHVESLTALAAPTQWFGPRTHMRAIAIGGSGPREHVSYEDGPVAEVVPWLQARFRTAFPGQMTIPGALYYNPDDQRYLWIICRRPHVGGQVRFGTNAQAFDFNYFKNLRVHDEIVTPEINLVWGQGLANAERVMAEQFDRYEEPPAWWSKTSWFWLHPVWQRSGSLEACQEAVKILSSECGVTGFGIALHDVPWSGRGVDPASLLPSPAIGGEDGLKKLTDTIKSVGGHSYVWSTRTGLHPVRDRRDSWCVRGEDGRRVRLAPPGSGVQIDVLNNDSGFRQYLFDTVRHYVTQLGVDGIFWDSGAQPMPPDFTDRGDGICPGESMVAPVRFYDDIYRFGRSLSPDFFMWLEGITTELRSNAFAVDNRKHGTRSAHAMMHRVARLGRRRIVFRSPWSHDLASGFPFIHPASDVGQLPDVETYRRIAACPTNRVVGRLVAERGHRDAVALTDGVSQLGDVVVVSPTLKEPSSFRVHAGHQGVLQSLVEGPTVQPSRNTPDEYADVPPGVYAIRPK